MGEIKDDYDNIHMGNDLFYIDELNDQLGLNIMSKTTITIGRYYFNYKSVICYKIAVDMDNARH
ncbi:hypothetical protein LGL08_21770 [Clostridium estertheticum]|nr:hypothetical protein [Clostridium estertheticum]MCB2352155.1 hypothetical protein [Clostridium estertheticum]